ncbi:MAG: carbon storage regulator [Thermotogota bacterium]
MLILSRKIGEDIIIKLDNKTVKIKLLEDQMGHIKLGFNAPKEIKIYRGELYEEIVKENKSSINSSFDAVKQIKESFSRGEKD